MFFLLHIYKYEYGNMRVVDLEALVKEHGLRGYSKLRKEGFFILLRNNQSMPAP